VALSAVLLPVLLGVAWTLVSDPPSRFALFENAVLRTLLIGVPWSLFLGRRDLWRLTAPRSTWEWLILGAIVAGAALWRFRQVPLPFHSDNWMASLVARVDSEPEPAFYGNGYAIFMRMFLLPGVSAEQAIFLGNRVAGILSVVAIYGVSRSLHPDSVAALWAAFLLAILPIHVRFSASETMQLVPILFTLIALVGFCGHAQRGSRALLATGLCAFTYAVLTRPDASGVAIALPFVYLPRRSWRWLRDPVLTIGLAIALAIGFPLLLIGVRRGMQQEFASVVLANWTTLDGLGRTLFAFREALTSAGPPHGALVPLAVLGLFSFFEAGRPWAVLLILTALAARLFTAGSDLDPGNTLQLFVPHLPWLILAAARVPADILSLTERLGGRIAGIALSAALSCVTLTASVRAPFFRLVWDVHEEWRYLERAASIVGTFHPGLPVIRGLRDQASPSLPAYMFPGHAVKTVDDLLAGVVAVPVIYFRGLDCYRGPGEQFQKGGLRPQCAEVETRYHVTEVSTTTVNAPDYSGRMPPEPMKIGFFLLDPERSDAW
jgi:hypothetical protein